MNLRRSFPTVVVALVAVVALAGCGNIQNSYGNASKPTTPAAGGAAASPATSATQSPVTGSTVTIQNFAFAPQTLTVKAGTKVTWTNNDSTQHDVTSTVGPALDAATTSMFASGNLSQGDSFSYTFTKAGTYYYECAIHASMATMHGTVVVQ